MRFIQVVFCAAVPVAVSACRTTRNVLVEARDNPSASAGCCAATPRGRLQRGREGKTELTLDVCCRGAILRPKKPPGRVPLPESKRIICPRARRVYAAGDPVQRAVKRSRQSFKSHH